MPARRALGRIRRCRTISIGSAPGRRLRRRRKTGAFNNQTLRMTMRASLGGIPSGCGSRTPTAGVRSTIGGAHIAQRDTGPGIVSGSDRKLTFGGAEAADNRGGRGFGQRPGRARPGAARRSRSQPLFARRNLERFSGHRPLRAADQLRLAAGRLHGGAGDADRQPHQRLVLRLRRRRARQRRDRRHRRARRLADRRQHLDDGRLLPLARPARPPPDGAPSRPADGGHEPGARRQPHPLRHSRRQRTAPLRPRRAGPAGRHPRDRHARYQRSAQPLEEAGGGADRGADDRRAQADGGARP